MEKTKILVLNNDLNKINFEGDLIAIVDLNSWESFIKAWYGDINLLNKYTWTIKNGKTFFPYDKNWFLEEALPKLNKLETIIISIAYDNDKAMDIKLMNPNQIMF